MEEILERIKNWFVAKRDHLEAFAQADSRVEGWFKAELILLLPKLVKTGHLESFQRECKVSSSAGRKQVDFSLTVRPSIFYFWINIKRSKIYNLVVFYSHS